MPYTLQRVNMEFRKHVFKIFLKFGSILQTILISFSFLRLPIGPRGSHVAIGVYSGSAYRVFHFDEFIDTERMVSAIRSMSHPDGDMMEMENGFKVRSAEIR